MQKKHIVGCLIGAIIGGMISVAFFLLFGPVLPPMVHWLLVLANLSPSDAEVDRMMASLIAFGFIFLPGAIIGGIYGWHDFVLEEKKPTRRAGRIF